MTRTRLLIASLPIVGLLACDRGAEAEPRSSATGEEAIAPADEQAASVCRVASSGSPLPEEVRETSGLAQSRRDRNLFWTHNDAGNGTDLFAVDGSGKLVGRVRVRDAEAVDWEDLVAGPCEGGNCLYVGDIGDNDAERESITIYEIPEPDPRAAQTEPARVLHARFPDGPRDAEALFILPSGDLYVVTKGRETPITLYRYPAPHRAGEVVTLERVRDLAAEPRTDEDRVTSATATPSGSWVGIRTYRTLLLYPAAALVGGGAATPTRVDLTPLGEDQGEALVLTDDGTVWVSSEAGNKDAPPRWGRLQCTFPSAAR